MLTGTKLAGANPERGRVDNDYYATPFSATNAILDRLEGILDNEIILEPAAGEGHIVKCLKEKYPNAQIIAQDLVHRNSRFDIDVRGGGGRTFSHTIIQ